MILEHLFTVINIGYNKYRFDKLENDNKEFKNRFDKLENMLETLINQKLLTN
jgi:hypothetical protein